MPPIPPLLIATAATLVTFVALDVAWLMLVAHGLFQSQLGPILRPQPDLMAAAAFYPIYAGGLVMLAVRPALQARSLLSAATNGAILGLTAYATFDLTNLAIIKGWTLGLALVDMAWGTIVSAIAASVGGAAGMHALAQPTPRANRSGRA